jgi:hypothetical protein
MTFDENGRKGSGVSYMDGMLMGRQSLAKLNTDNKVIAQSVIYDFQGRPAISILPTPVSSECLSYKNGLNLNNSGANYNELNFDDDGASACVSATDPLSINAGASNYYSSNNTNKEGAQGYLPDAKELPFVQVEYTNDMTGRIKSQSMPGEAHKLGDGKETKFYYSNPGDGELYQLFGSEVGNVKHYDKNIVSDANGQLSASYIDMEGRVIATSLLGPKPANVEGVEGYNSSAPLKDNLVNFNITDKDNYTITSTKNVFIEQAGAAQTFTYEFMPEDYYDACANVCFDCIYEFEFKVTDNCNTNIIPPVTAVVGNLSETKFDINHCENPMLSFEMSPGAPLSVVFPNVGNYVITKTLKVSDKNLDRYIESYIANNGCFGTYEEILQQQVEAIDFSTCNTDCQSCSTSVASYVANYPATHNNAVLSANEIEILYQECSNLCLDQMDPCFMKRQQMLQDFYPDGQYALYNHSTYAPTDNASIFDPANKLGIYYADCSINYLDDQGNIAKANVYRMVGTQLQLFNLPVCSLTVKEFVDNFQPTWANALLNHHPEICYLNFCDANKESDQYDYGMLQVNTYDEAYAKGYLKPIAGVAIPNTVCPSPPSSSKPDPFFGTYSNALPGAGNITADNTIISATFGTYKNLMISYFANYPETSSPPIWVSGSPSPNWTSIFDAARVIGSENQNSVGFGCDPCTKDKEWLAFRALYLQQKMRIYAQAKTDYVIKNGCFNGCMQGSGLQANSPNEFKPNISNPLPQHTSLNFLKGNFTIVFNPQVLNDPFTLSAYPVNTSPQVPLNPNFNDGYFQNQSTSTIGIHPCSNNQVSFFVNKVARFQQIPFDAQSLLNHYGNLLSNNPSSGPNSSLPATISSPPLSNASNYCQNTCESYAEQWILKLKNCNPIFDNSNLSVYNLPANVTLRNQIMNDLIAVCADGCNPQNPYGSSTINPALPNPTYTSFDDVINHYITNGTLNNSIACSSLNLDFPEPYNHDYSASGNAQNKLDTCGCNKILNTKEKFGQLLTAGTLPSGVTTVEQYFDYLYHTSILNFNELVCKCTSVLAQPTDWNTNYIWTQSQSTTLQSYSVTVPEAISCTKCLPCSTVVNAINNFNEAHPNWSENPSYNGLLENSLNASLNMNLSYSDYLNYYNNCVGVVNSSANTTRTQLESFLNGYVNARFNILPTYTPITYQFTNIAYTVLGSGYNPAYPVLPQVGMCSVLNLNIGDIVNYNIGGGTYSQIQITGFPIGNFTDNIRLPKIQFPEAFTGFSPLVNNSTSISFNNSPGAGPFHENLVFGNNPYPSSPCSGSSITECFLLMQDLSAYVHLPGFQISNISFSGLAGKIVTGVPTAPNHPANFYYEYSYTDITGHKVVVTNNFGYYSCIYQEPYPITTLCNKPLVGSLPIYEDCMSSMLNQAQTNAQLIYKSYVDKYTAQFKEEYYKKCLAVQEQYQREYALNEYHYTLYYYDQAGNLVRTVAPKGVNKLPSAQVAQLQAPNPPTIIPSHSYVTNYKYQSYGAPLESKTPDETDETEYIYDNIGRIQLSVNAKQKNESKYSYTLYDDLGRIEEVGVLTNVPPTITIAVFKSQIALNNFRSFISTLTKTEVISTYYDAPLNTAVSSQFGSNGQQNLRNRVASVTYENTFDNNYNTYNYATHYTYDEHGNVGRIIQDIPALSPVGKQFYTLDYEYDLISGNVNKVTYQKEAKDMFIHKYEYDNDNRLHQVYTSYDNVNWDRDAKYFYYEHGPLARVEVGDQKVQGTDFAYTIHGWIKAVNSNALDKSADMGKDAAQGNRYISSQFNLHQYIAEDASGYSLNYYQSANGPTDYQSIKSFNNADNKNMLASTANILSSGTPFNLTDDAPNLYNGNISSMVTSIIDMDLNANNTHANFTSFPQITAYKYDQLHRIKQMKAFRDISFTNNSWNTANGSNYDGSYFSQFTYDKNGNILSQLRNGAGFMNTLGLPMDNLTYAIDDASATNPTNKLINVADAAGGNYTADIKTTPSGSTGNDYDYDEIGSLKKDNKEYISSIEWTVDRKVKKVIRNGALMASHSKNMPDLEFEYDANRQRVVKIVKPHDGTTGALLNQDHWVYTYYVRDASGNISAVYSKKFVPVAGQPNTFTELYNIEEVDIYGSSRLGTLPVDIAMGSSDFTANIVNGIFQNISYVTPAPVNPNPCLVSITDPVTGAITRVPCPESFVRYLGHKRYEQTNHLGNVITVVSDRKIQQSGNTVDLINDYEQAFNNQSALPAPLAGSTYCAKLNNSFSPNIFSEVQVGDAVTASVDYFKQPSSTGLLVLSITDENGNFLYDNDVTDAATNEIWLSTPVLTNGSWQSLSINKTIYPVFTDVGRSIPYTGRIYINSHEWNPNANDCWFDNHSIHIAQANPMVINYKPEILETHDYYAFGAPMPGRNFNAGDYRYGLNGMEKVDEVTIGHYTAEYWEYDSRIGRRWNTDPIVKPFESPYATFRNNPIYFADPSGLDGEPVNKTDAAGQKGETAVNGGVKNGDGSITGGNPVCLGCGDKGEDTYGIPSQPGDLTNPSSGTSAPTTLPSVTTTNNTINNAPRMQYDNTSYYKFQFNVTYGAQGGFKVKTPVGHLDVYANLKSEEWLSISAQKSTFNGHKWDITKEYMGDDDKKKVTSGFAISAAFAGYEHTEEEQVYWKGSQRGTVLNVTSSDKVNAMMISYSKTAHNDTKKVDENVNAGFGFKIAALIGVEVSITKEQNSVQK